jgi:hypothetical protein
MGLAPQNVTRVAASPIMVQRVTGVDLTRCPVCGVGRLRVVASFRPGYFPAPPLDTS